MVALFRFWGIMTLTGFLLASCMPSLPILETTNKIATPEARAFTGRIGCQLNYTVRSKYNRLNDEAQLGAIKKALTLWQGAYPSLRFNDVTNLSAIPNINIYFTAESDSVLFKKNPSYAGFFTSSATELSSVVQKSSREYALYLNVNHDWKPDQITRTILFHVGYMLGLSLSDDIGSVMYPQLTEVPASINETDKNNLKKAFPDGCQVWVEHTVPFPGAYGLHSALTFKVGERFFAIAPDISFNDRSYLLLEFDPENISWKRRKSFKPRRVDPYSNYRFAFGTTSHAYFGILSPLSPADGEFFSYDVANDNWESLTADLLPKLAGAISSVICVNSVSKGYMGINYTWEGLSYLQFDPLNKVWDKIDNPTLPPPGPYSFFSNNKKAYYMSVPYFQELDINSNTWTTINAPRQREVNLRHSGFADDDYVYIIETDSYANNTPPQKIWIFDANKSPASTWQLLTTIPEKAGTNPGLSFAVKNRIFMYTSDSTLWEYRP